MDLAGAVTEALDRLLAAGRVEVRENGAWLATLEDFRYELRQQGDVAAAASVVAGEQPGAPRSAHRGRHGGPADAGGCALRPHAARPAGICFRAGKAERPDAVLREQFCARFRDLLARQFPDEELASLTAARGPATFAFRKLRARNPARGLARLGRAGRGARERVRRPTTGF